MQTLINAPIAPYTSFEVGGLAENLMLPETYEEMIEALQHIHQQNLVHQVLGFGTNSLVSDEGLPGNTIIWRGGTIAKQKDELIVDGGVWWDDMVVFAVERSLWGCELLSEIPGTVGAGVVGNIAAYGQQISDHLKWIEAFNTYTGVVEKIDALDITFSYRSSSLQVDKHLIVLRAGFSFPEQATGDIKYESVKNIASELKADVSKLSERRRAVIATRQKAGSIYHPNDTTYERTAGSFFKNPLVSFDLAKELAHFDESGATLDRVLAQNTVHGGSQQRASAAHVLLACGFNRGQQWGSVRLHPDHVLKIENTGGATAQDIKNVADEIMKTVHQKLKIKLEPEVKFLGKFL